MIDTKLLNKLLWESMKYQNIVHLFRPIILCYKCQFNEWTKFIRMQRWKPANFCCAAGNAFKSILHRIHHTLENPCPRTHLRFQAGSPWAIPSLGWHPGRTFWTSFNDLKGQIGKPRASPSSDWKQWTVQPLIKNRLKGNHLGPTSLGHFSKII